MLYLQQVVAALVVGVLAVGVMVIALLLSLVMIRIEKELPKEMRPK